MTLLSYNTDNMAQVEIVPRRVTMISTDDLGAITASGYITPNQQLSIGLLPSDEIIMFYNYNPSESSGILGIFNPTFSNGIVTLVQTSGASNVTLPVVDGHIAVFDGTTGKIKDGGGAPLTTTSNLVTGNPVVGTGANTVGPASGKPLFGVTDVWAGGSTSHQFTATPVVPTCQGTVMMRSQSNGAAITSCTYGNGNILVSFTEDPGGNTQLQYSLYTFTQS